MTVITDTNVHGKRGIGRPKNRQFDLCDSGREAGRIAQNREN